TNLAPYQPFRSQEPYRQTKQVTFLCMGEPCIIYATESIDGVKNYVNQIIVFKYLSQPPGIGQLNAKSDVRKTLRHMPIIFWLAENIKVFRIALYTRMKRQCKTTTNHEITCAIEQYRYRIVVNRSRIFRPVI